MNVRIPYLLVLLTAVLLLVITSCTKQAEEPAYTFTAYDDHLTRITFQQPFNFNIVASVGEDGILLVDTGPGFPVGAVHDAVRQLSDLPIRKILITHTHTDHIGGLPELQEEATIYASDQAIEQTYLNLAPRQLFTRETVAIEDTVEIQFNGDTIRMWKLPPGHDGDDIIIYFVESNLMCIGGRAITTGWPFVDFAAGGTLDEVVGRMQQLAETYPDVLFNSSHGPDLTADELIAYHDTLSMSIALVNEQLDAGRTVEQIIADGVLAPWDTLGTGFLRHENWINQIRRERGDDLGPQLTSICEPLTTVLEADGIEAMIERYHQLRETHPDDYDFGEAHLNLLGYELTYRQRYEEAREVLRLNMEQFPASANVYDSFGEVHLLLGDTTTAVQYYRQAAATDSTFQNARTVLARLGYEVEG